MMDYHTLVATNLHPAWPTKMNAVSEDAYYWKGTISLSVLPLQQVARVLASLALTFHAVAAKFV
jgi:hypothetical protein